MKNKKPDFIKVFAIDSGLDPKNTLVRTVYEKESVEPDSNKGLRGGWMLTGKVTYFIKDDVSEFEINIQRISGHRLG